MVAFAAGLGMLVAWMLALEALEDGERGVSNAFLAVAACSALIAIADSFRMVVT